MQRAALVSLSVLLVAACAPGDRSPDGAGTDGPPPGVVDVAARGLTLQAPAEIPTGWTTFRFSNESPMIHFAAVERLPQGQGIASQQAEVAPVFQDGMDLLTAGDPDAALAEFGKLPAWFGDIVFLGGPGLTSPGETSQATVYLEPGTYLLECYVKTDGVFHSYNSDPAIYGMVHEFTVTADSSAVPEPDATLRLELSSSDGITMTGTATAGEHTVAVYFVDQTHHENFVGHDVHLLSLADDTDLEAVEQWMDWRLPTGLETPAPARFLGGLNEMPSGSTGYLTVTLSPGTYAWVAEVPGTDAKGMLQTFQVEEAEH